MSKSPDISSRIELRDQKSLREFCGAGAQEENDDMEMRCDERSQLCMIAVFKRLEE